MNYEDLTWINQSLYSYMDKQYDSHGFLDISVSINTSDNLTFSQPKLTFNLDNQGQRRNISLSYINVVDILQAFNDIGGELKEVFSRNEKGAITRRYNKNKDFVFEFQLLNNSAVVCLMINHGGGDIGKIIFPVDPNFRTIGQILRLFQENYVKFSLDLPNRYLNSLSVNRLQSIETLFKILPTQLAPIQQESYPTNYQDKGDLEKKYNGLICPDCGEAQYETPSGEVCKNGHGGMLGIDPAEQANEFEKFAAEEEPKVRIPELESDVIEPKEAISQEYKSPFIQGTLKNNILNLEEMLNALTTNNYPLLTIMNTINNGQGYTLLPGINEDDLKSVAYVSNLYFKINFQSYIQNQTGFPIAVPVVKYHTDEEVDRDTIELSYDLLFINAYLKIYRNRMEAINSDPYSNGALVHFMFRCFLDVATFSYLNGQNTEAVKSNVLSRYKYFNESGFFSHYDKNLESDRQRPVTISEISDFLEKVFDNVIESDDINIRHFNAHDTGSVKLPPKNKFNLEQITNDIVKNEIKVMFGQRIEDLSNDEDIILLFNTKLKKKYKPTDHRPEKRKTETHVLRYIKLKANELPENVRADFVKYIGEMAGDKYDYFNSTFKLEELPEIILQTVYVWNKFIDDTMKYTDFATQVEDCIDKNLIISKIKEDTSEEESTDDWSAGFDNIEI